MQKIITRAEAKERGLKRYFNANPCRRYAHVAERQTSNGVCIECLNLSSKNRVEYYKGWAEENREKLLRYKSEWHYKNKARMNKNNTDWYAANREYALAYVKNWCKNNPDKVYENSVRRRARLANAEGSHTRKDVNRILLLQRNKCANCKKTLKPGFHVDHVQPLFLGGSNSADNLQMLCPRCNFSKSAQDPVDWARKNGRLI